MKRLGFELKYIIMLWLALLASLLLTFSSHGSLIADCGREAYYPTQILAGEVLYKDIFNIYGPFAYMFNAFLFKVFGISLNVLYMAGSASAFLIISLIYFIAKKFISDFNAFCLSFFVLVTGVFSANLFNFVFPYSFGILYGFIFVLASVFLLIEYVKSQKLNYFYLASFFAGLAVISKYDFFPYIFVLFYAAFAVNKLSVKEFFKGAAAFAAAPTICFLILFAQGLGIGDLFSSFSFLNKMLSTDTLKYFYRHSGVYPSVYLFTLVFKKLVETIIPIALLFFASRINIIILRWLTIAFALILIFTYFDGLSFVFLPMFVLLWSLIDFKKIRSDKSLMILLLSSLLISVKEFWGLILYNYGIFYAPLLLVSISALVSNRFKDKKMDAALLGFYFSVVALVFLMISIPAVKAKSGFVKTDRGTFHIAENMQDSSQKFLDFLKNDTKKSDKVVIFPEGLLFNFLAERKSDNYYSSLIPLYVETFGEDNIIEHFKSTKPDYVVFNNWDTGDYYLKKICEDYAVSFCSYVVDNYDKVAVFSGDLEYTVFKKR